MWERINIGSIFRAANDPGFTAARVGMLESPRRIYSIWHKAILNVAKYDLRGVRAEEWPVESLIYSTGGNYQ